MPLAKRLASRSPDGERRSKRQLTSSPPEEGEVDDDAEVVTTSLPPQPGPIALKTKIPFPFKQKAQPPAGTTRNINVFEQQESAVPAVYERPKDDRVREDSKRKPRPPADHWEPASSSSRLHTLSRNPRDRRSPSPVHRSRSPYSAYSEKHRMGTPEIMRYPLSPPPGRWQYDERPRESRRYDGYDAYDDRDRGHYRPSQHRADPRAWTRREDTMGRRDGHYDPYAPHSSRHDYRSPPRDSYHHSYRPMSPERDSYRPVSPRPPSPRPPLSPPRTRAHSPPPPPTSSPPPPPPPDTRLIPRDAPLPPPPASLPPRPNAPLDFRSPPAITCPPPPEVRKETVRIMRKPPPPRRSQVEEEAAYGRVFKGCSSQQEYAVTTKLGEGTFGESTRPCIPPPGGTVALKRILMHNEKEGMPVTALREIKILKALDHPCIVRILDMFVVRSTGGRPALCNERVKLQPSHIKLYMRQLLEGTEYMHRNHILHPTPARCSSADFGLARAFDAGDNPNRGGKERKLHKLRRDTVVPPPGAAWLGARQYGGEVDLWGIGCVLGEMFMRRPILPGTSDLDQLDKIWTLCGTPNQHSWPNFDSLPGAKASSVFNAMPRKLKASYEHIGKETCDLLDRLLTCNPRERITAAQALDHDYFWTDPMPADPRRYLPVYEASHEFDKRGHRQQQQQHAGPPPTHAHLHQADPHRQYRAPPPGAVPPQTTQSAYWRPGPPPRYGGPPPGPRPLPNWQPPPPRGGRDSYEPRGPIGGAGVGVGGKPPGLPPRPVAPQGTAAASLPVPLGMPRGAIQRMAGPSGGEAALNYG
ncbi:kinase-like domain-containing protein [Mycena sp. CBHHK59/15]|nr:kinase-like domain-containing protein [Mycena sp. CBHHK59/15]